MTPDRRSREATGSLLRRSDAAVESGRSGGLLIDITRCIGCGACIEARKSVNDPPPHIDAGLSVDTWTVVRARGEGFHVRDLCRHCVNPSCVSVCPVKALRKIEFGSVVYDASICLGCRYRMIGCPFSDSEVRVELRDPAYPEMQPLSPAPRARGAGRVRGSLSDRGDGLRRPRPPMTGAAAPLRGSSTGGRILLASFAPRP
jgi:Fe-S-cluster-containing hydrogenase component 2